MQMKMEKKSVNKQALRQLLEKEDEFITTLFRNCEVPTQVDGKLINFTSNAQLESNFSINDINIIHLYSFIRFHRRRIVGSIPFKVKR